MSGNRRNNWNYWDNNQRGRPNRGGWGGGKGSWREGHQQDGNYRGGNRQNYGGRNNQQWQNKPRRETVSKRLCESDIGVTEYINDHKGFLGIIKSRYSDFQVSEINEKGEIAKLTDLSVPEAPVEEVVVEDEDLLLSKYNVEILPMDTWDRINKLALATEPITEKVEIDVTGMSKEHRTKIHDAVKKAFAESIVGSTVTIDDKKFVRFEKYRKGVRIDNRVKWIWPGEYVYFIVHKENCDTMDAAIRIAERLKLSVKPGLLGYAGTKDRRAKTSQWFSLRRIAPNRIAAACKELRDIKIGNFTFQNCTLKLGMLKGNRFRIALRNVTVNEETVNTSCKKLRDGGFLNYYGLQRFGTRFKMPTYEIGLKLLQGNFRGAISSILQEREGPLQHALHLYRNSGPLAAYRAIPRFANSTIEGRLLKSLARDKNDLLGAINKVPRNTRLLYIHSYQSIIWNRAVSERVRRFGLEPAVGDLVPLSELEEEIEDEEFETEENQDDAETDQDETEQDGGKQDGDATDKDDANEKTDKHENKDSKKKTKFPVKVLTQEDIDSGRFSIFDVIMPLPGHYIEYPPNMQEFYEQLLTKDELTMDMKHKIKSYCMSGAYRHVVVRPLDMRWRSVRYTDPYADLLLSDLDELENKTSTGIVDDGKYKALLLTFSLPASCYATMALRELLKVDTSGDFQSLQNNYHKKGENKKNKPINNKEKADGTQDGDAVEKADDNAGENSETKDSVQSENNEVAKDSSDDKKQTDDFTEIDTVERGKIEDDSTDAGENGETKDSVQSENNEVAKDSSDDKMQTDDVTEIDTAEKRKIEDDTSEVDAKRLKQSHQTDSK